MNQSTIKIQNLNSKNYCWKSSWIVLISLCKVYYLHLGSCHVSNEIKTHLWMIIIHLIGMYQNQLCKFPRGYFNSRLCNTFTFCTGRVWPVANWLVVGPCWKTDTIPGNIIWWIMDEWNTDARIDKNDDSRTSLMNQIVCDICFSAYIGWKELDEIVETSF